MDRPAKLALMRDLLEHLSLCHEEWESALGRAEHFLAESMKRDLAELGRLCESLRSESRDPAMGLFLAVA